jgi:hypothetical protein
MAEGRPSLIDAVMPAQGMPLGGLGDEEIEVEEIQEPTDMLEQDDGSVLINYEEVIQEQMLADQDANLAELLDERVLMETSDELLGYYEDDKASRQE